MSQRSILTQLTPFGGPADYTENAVSNKEDGMEDLSDGTGNLMPRLGSAASARAALWDKGAGSGAPQVHTPLYSSLTSPYNRFSIMQDLPHPASCTIAEHVMTKDWIIAMHRFE